MSLEHPVLTTPPPPRGATMKFTYANGDRPLGGYTIKRGIGRGGFGEVYFALSDGGKEVALKLIRRSLDVELRGVSQCLNLKHPNLIALYDVRRDQHDDYWVVMEYVSGRSLEEVIADQPRGLPLDEALAWLHGLAAGVAYLHDKGVVHRDLKPGNIFSDEGMVKIGDYGLAKFISASRRSGQTESVGTVHYMAPEISHGRYGKEIDIYALGIMLYEMLTGHVPFEGESVGEVLMKHMTAEPDVSGLAEPYRTVVAKALAKDPAERFSSVADFLAGLPPPPHGSPAAVVVPVVAITPGPAAGPVVPAAVVGPQLVQEEPFWQATREAWRQITDAWTRANFSLPIKIVIVLAGAFVLTQTLPVIGPALLCGVVVYGGYRVVRAVLLARAGTPAVAAAVAVAAVPTPVAAPPPRPESPCRTGPAGGSPFREEPVAHGRRSWRLSRGRQEQAVPALLVKSGRQKVTELFGSLLLSSVIAVALSLALSLLMRDPAERNQVYWLAVVATAGAWGVLVPAKFWEGTQGEQLPRRILLLLMGLGVGLGAFGVAETLLVDLKWFADPGLPPVTGFRQTLVASDGAPLLKGYLVYFGLLFPVLRWWRLADPLRSTRLSVWCVVLCSLWAWVLGAVWPFPQLWGAMVAAIVAVAVQLSSPWVDTRRAA